ncbi:unnamed protein product [Arabidopsis thaliana]|uniref:RRM domain-containing protein n=2 Tax=Arabidopsis thaliana TaxID=3702 RepID=A0A5S9WPV4_ARATH|nr:unnamed protein product [Arabidopsis thaliana]
MSDALNMTLDEIVKKSKSERSAAARSGGKGVSRKSGRGRGGPNGVVGAGRGGGPVRRVHDGTSGISSECDGSLSFRFWLQRLTDNTSMIHMKLVKFTCFPTFHLVSPWMVLDYFFLELFALVLSAKWLARRKRSLPWQNQNDLYEETLRAVGVSGVEVGTTVYITNLDQGVTNEDIRELYAEIGELKRYAIHYDRNGRPSGSAEVVYMRRSDAIQAMRKYNNVLLDGRPMKLEILGGSTESAPVAARVNVTGLNGRMKRSVFIGQGVRGGRVGRGRGSGPSGRRLPVQQNQQGGRGGRGGVRGRGRGAGGGRGNKSGGRGGKKPVEKSAADLDKDLESYHAEAMNIS